MTHTVLSVFAGIGGLDLAAHWAGFETVGFIEREPFCKKVLAKHWPSVPIHSDVFDYHSTEHVDVVCGGFPCQPFSVAGNRKGADDERYLLPEMLRIIREVKPYAVLFENVPGFPSLNDGAEFKYLLRALAEMGFDAEWGHLRASDSGAPHQRERWFCVAYSQHNGHIAATRKRSDGTAVRNHAQGQDSAREFARISTPEFMADTTSARAGGYTGGLPEARRGTRETLGGWTGVGNGGQDVADTASLRRERHPAGQGQDRLQQGRTSELARGNKLTLGNPTSAGLEGRNQRQPKLAYRSRPGTRSTQPRLCGTPDGLPGWLDFPGWPARPGEDQHPYEPSRVTSAKTPDRAARLKACGNAVVPQVAYPLFVAIYEWLQEKQEAQS